MLVAAVLLLVAGRCVASATPPPALVIATPGRSGSSFVSSWLAHGVGPSRVQYFLEPCSASYHTDPPGRDVGGAACAEVLGRLLRCDFSTVTPGRQTSTGDPLSQPWGNTTSIDGCGKDGPS